MRLSSDPHGALRWVASSVTDAQDEIKVAIFRGHGGTIRDANGTYTARYARVSASATAGDLAAVKAWARKAWAQLDPADLEGKT
jgi:hypothetical protein